MDIKLDDLTDAKVIQLVCEHLQGMASISPPESVHALGVEALQKPDISFFSVWDGAELAGCGALKELDQHHGEIKSMRTVSLYLRKGVATQVLRHILDEAKRRGYRRLSLETGSEDAFEPARRLYANFGFQYCDPFADYTLDPNSVFMTLEL